MSPQVKRSLRLSSRSQARHMRPCLTCLRKSATWWKSPKTCLERQKSAERSSARSRKWTPTQSAWSRGRQGASKKDAKQKTRGQVTATTTIFHLLCRACAIICNHMHMQMFAGLHSKDWEDLCDSEPGSTALGDHDIHQDASSSTRSSPAYGHRPSPVVAPPWLLCTSKRGTQQYCK